MRAFTCRGWTPPSACPAACARPTERACAPPPPARFRQVHVEAPEEGLELRQGDQAGPARVVHVEELQQLGVLLRAEGALGREQPPHDQQVLLLGHPTRSVRVESLHVVVHFRLGWVVAPELDGVASWSRSSKPSPGKWGTAPMRPPGRWSTESKTSTSAHLGHGQPFAAPRLAVRPLLRRLQQLGARAEADELLEGQEA